MEFFISLDTASAGLSIGAQHLLASASVDLFNVDDHSRRRRSRPPNQSNCGLHGRKSGHFFVKSNSAASQDGNNTDANTDYDNTIIQSLYQGLEVACKPHKKFPNNNKTLCLLRPILKTDSSGNITSISYIFKEK